MTIKDFYWLIAVVIIVSAVLDRIQNGYSLLALPAAIALIYVVVDFYHRIEDRKHGRK